jgi:GAF domain-containing protein
VTGVIVLSNLGTDQFDEEDQRVLEVLASHAAVAYENASLLQKEREAAKTSSALLGLSQALTGAGMYRRYSSGRGGGSLDPALLAGCDYHRDPRPATSRCSPARR